MAYIELKNIDLTYEDKVLFNDFNLSVEKGEKVLIGGKSGAGKSSLIKILLGFRKMNSGYVQINNKKLKSGDYSDLRNMYAYVNQDVTVRHGRVLDFLHSLEGYKNSTFKMEGQHGLAQELMDLFEFDKSLVYKNTEDLSGGERQRLGIIIAIMLKRPVFLLDEITSALDYDLKKKVAGYFADCQETVISISHDVCWEETGSFRKVVW